jgi:alkanesulfonate monooxygenase SsuD/methylene tetrahydromethanopterin reductase-like flavin-dependent oxidoreductase (luciferase family)
VKFGVFILGEKPPMLPGDEVYRRNLDQARAADDMGYDTIWIGEHHFSPYGTIADPFVFGAAVATVTKHARIGTAVVIPAFANPIRMAEQVAMVDAISGGRFDLGLGRGYQQKEFKKFGIPMEESTERFIEFVDVIEKLLTHESYSWEGKFSHGEDINIFPRPIQNGVPFYIAVLRTASTIDWAVSKGYGTMVGNPYIPDPELSKSLELLQQSHDKHNVDRDVSDTWALTTAFTNHDRDFALNYPRDSVRLNMQFLQQYAAPFERGETVPQSYQAYSNWYDTIASRDIDPYDKILQIPTSFIGSPDSIIDKIRVMNKEQGWENFILTLNKGGAMEQEHVLEAMKIFAEEIIPAARENAVKDAESKSRVDAGA